ncbi:TniQ family protein [Bacillus sp. DJP31]|uniref:TniQ family protein n=1 Tax=Bacillus sp. DJP31 TaxID=3409789 RepID=UPI003BB54DCD
MKTKPLMRRSDLFEGESLGGYLYRLSKINHYQSPSFLKEIGLKMNDIESNSIPYEVVSELSRLTIQHEDDLFSRSNYYIASDWDRSMEKLLLLKSRVKFCPLCIKKEAYHKWIWNINPVSICLTHRIYLVSHCKECGSSVQMNSLINVKCKECELNLVNSKTIKVQQNSYLYQSQENFISYLLDSTNQGIMGEKALIEYMDLAKRSLNLLEDQKSFINPKEKVIHSFLTKMAGYYDLENWSVALANVYWMYQDFPHNFYNVLDQFNSNIPYELRKRRRRQFEVLFQGGKNKAIEEAYRNYKIKKAEKDTLHSNFAFYHKDEAETLRGKFVNKKVLIEEYGISRYQINQFLDKKLNSHDATQYKIKKNELESLIRYQKIQKDIKTAKEVATILGVSVEVIGTFLQEGALQKVNIPTLKDEYILKDQVENLQRVLFKKFDIDTQGMIPFNIAIRQNSWCGFTVIYMYKCIQEGFLNPVYSQGEPKFTDLLFKKSEIKSCLQSLKEKYNNEIGLTSIEVIRRLKVTDDTLKKMVDAQLLLPSKKKITSNGSVCYWFKEEEVMQLQTEYFGVSEAVNEFSITDRQVRKLIQSGAITNYFSGINRKVLLKRSELEEVLET